MDGTFDNRSNDLSELCLDFIYYRDLLIKETAKGNTIKPDDVRHPLVKINVWLDAYHEDDKWFMWTLIDEKGW